MHFLLVFLLGFVSALLSIPLALYLFLFKRANAIIDDPLGANSAQLLEQENRRHAGVPSLSDEAKVSTDELVPKKRTWMKIVTKVSVNGGEQNLMRWFEHEEILKMFFFFQTP
jgi:hypothetical protein